MRMTEDWNRLSRAVVESPSLKVSQELSGPGPGLLGSVQMVSRGPFQL